MQLQSLTRLRARCAGIPTEVFTHYEKNKKVPEKQKDKAPLSIRIALSHWIDNIKFADIIVILLLGFLATGDYFVLHQTFMSGNSASTSEAEAVFYAIIFALCLEGTPYVLANAVNTLFSKHIKGKTKEIVKTVMTVVLSFAFLIALFSLVTDLRQNIIDQRGGQDAFDKGTYGVIQVQDADEEDTDTAPRGRSRESYLVDRFLKYEPIGTSILAFLFSFVFLKSGALITARRAMIRAQRRTQKIRKYASNLRNEFEIKKHTIWNSAGIGVDNVFDKQPYDEPPDDFDEFLKCLQDRKRKSVLRDGYEIFDVVADRYNNRIVAEVFQVLLSRMSLRSSLPETIRNISIDDIIKDRDEKKEGKEKWDTAKDGNLKAEYWDRLISHPLIRPDKGHGVGEGKDEFGDSKNSNRNTTGNNNKNTTGASADPDGGSHGPFKKTTNPEKEDEKTNPENEDPTDRKV